MEIKLIALDLDDTLLDHSRLISPRARQAIQAAVSQGVVVTLATGRMFKSAQPYAKQLGLDVPIITYNGGLIKSGLSQEVLYHQPLSEDVARQVADMCRQHNWYVQTYIDDNLYVQELNDKAKFYSDLAGVETIPVGEELFCMRGQPTKMLTIGEPEEIIQMKQTFDKRFGDILNTVDSRPIFLEIMHKKVNKGRALCFLAEKLGISQQNVMALGDSNNDVDMLSYAGLGVAMGNAAASIKAIANAVTKGNDEDGVAEAIEKYVLK